MIIGYHLIWTAYGWWLPNDPRGSMSQVIRNDVIADLGELHFGRKRVQPAGRDIRAFYNAAASRLKHDLRTFDERERQVLAACFADMIAEHRYTCYACAIMPDHIHMLIRKHKFQAEQMIEHFQSASRTRFRGDGLRDEHHPVWGGPGWKVFLDSPDDIRRTIRYIIENPIRIGLPQQHWPFVEEYNNWPFHKRG